MAEHPNRVPFEGVLTLVDVPSDKAPSGARGHRVILMREAAAAAMPTLLGMGVNYKGAWDGHDARQKVGVIDSAWLTGHELRVSGYIYGRDFPEVLQEAHDEPLGPLGMSYELADVHVVDMGATIWLLERATFCGAAILLREKAAYRKTLFALTGNAVEALAAASEGLELKGCA